MRRRNPTLGMVELWHRLRNRGYTRRPESLFRMMRKLGMFPDSEKKEPYKPKPYEQMTYPGQRVQVDVKVVPRKCITDPELRLFQYTAIDEFTRLHFLAAYPEQSTYLHENFRIAHYCTAHSSYNIMKWHIIILYKILHYSNQSLMFLPIPTV